jgi:hypothetical protein
MEEPEYYAVKLSIRKGIPTHTLDKELYEEFWKTINMRVTETIKEKYGTKADRMLRDDISCKGYFALNRGLRNKPPFDVIKYQQQYQQRYRLKQTSQSDHPALCQK